jgi:hypothetical protein
MTVSFGGNDQLNSLINQLGQIGQRGSYTPQMKLPAPKPQAVLQGFTGLGSGYGANSGVTGGIGAVPGDLGRLMAAIKGKESGGNYSAYNPSGASGAYQILKGNIPSWSQEALGHQVSYSQFMNSPAIQDQIARYKLGQYLKSRGMAGAAATWYGGDYGYRHMYDKKPQNGYPSIYAYVMSILNSA